MPRKWTKAQRDAQSRKIKAVWEKKKQAKQTKLTWWQRFMLAVGLSKGA